MSDTVEHSDRTSQVEIPQLSKHVQEKVLKRCNVQIHDLLNFETIFPHLVQANLLTRREQGHLQSFNTSLSEDQKITKLINLLPKKGSDALQRFVSCLWDTADGTGHAELADFIQSRVVPLHKGAHGVSEKSKTTSTQLFLFLFFVALLLAVGLLWWSGGFHWLYSLVMYQLNLPFSKTLPPRLNTFVGRENDTQSLLQLLRFHSDSDTKIVNIIGSPGFGKSTLAIEVGNKMVEERVVVHYVDMAEFPNMQVKQVLAEKVLNSAMHTSQPNVTFNQLVDWAGRTVWYNLLILDNCDDSINQQKDDFYEAIATLIQYSQYLKILLTSREETMYLHPFQPHKIQTLSAVAACKLLEYKIPSRLSLMEKEKIAELTGNVPLALQIIGSLLNMPDPPSPTEIIDQLGIDPINTLTPPAMWYKQTLNASISLSYNYLKPNIQKHGRYLANFPGSFDMHTATDCLRLISSDPQKTTAEYFESSIRKLVSLSLLEHNKRSNQYHFHRLIREFFLGVQSSTDGIQEKRRFILAFQRYYSSRLRAMTIKFHTDSSAALHMLERERHNVQHLLVLITSPVNISHDSYFHAIHSIEYALTVGYLGCRFTTEEVVSPIQSVTNVLQTKMLTVTAQSSTQNFVPLHNHFYMFTRYVVRLSELRAFSQGRLSAFKTMRNRLYLVETVASQSTASDKDFVQGYTYYYTNLLQFKEYLDGNTTKTFTSRVLQKLDKWQTNYCDPTNCQNRDIGHAYFQIEEYEKSVEFLEKALNDSDLELTTRIDVITQLYISHQRMHNFEERQKLYEDLVDLYPNIVASFQMDLQSSARVDNVIAIFRIHGENDKAAVLWEKLIESVLQLESQTTSNIVLINSAVKLAKELRQQSNYTRAIEIASVALKALEYLNQEQRQIWDTGLIQLELKLTIGIGKYYNTTHEAVHSEGLIVLMEVADFIIERNATVTTVYASTFSETCTYLGWHLKYMYSCYLRDSDVLHYINKVSSALLFSLFFLPLPESETQHIVDEPFFPHDPLPLDKYPTLIHESRSKEVTKKEWFALAEFYLGFNETNHSNQDPSYSSYFETLIKKAIRLLLKIGQVRFVINVFSIWIRLYIAYYCILYSIKCTCCLPICCFRGIRSIPVVVATLQTFIVIYLSSELYD